MPVAEPSAADPIQNEVADAAADGPISEDEWLALESTLVASPVRTAEPVQAAQAPQPPAGDEDQNWDAIDQSLAAMPAPADPAALAWDPETVPDEFLDLERSFNEPTPSAILATAEDAASAAEVEDEWRALETALNPVGAETPAATPLTLVAPSPAPPAPVVAAVAPARPVPVAAPAPVRPAPAPAAEPYATPVLSAAEAALNDEVRRMYDSVLPWQFPKPAPEAALHFAIEDVMSEVKDVELFPRPATERRTALS
jgi:hypothetical protein